MELDIKIPQTVKPKTLKIHLKVCDEFSCELLSDKGDLIKEQEDGYVPSFMPGEHYGDYVILDIDVLTGQITNWDKFTKDRVEKWLEDQND